MLLVLYVLVHYRHVRWSHWVQKHFIPFLQLGISPCLRPPGSRMVFQRALSLLFLLAASLVLAQTLRTSLRARSPYLICVIAPKLVYDP